MGGGGGDTLGGRFNGSRYIDGSFGVPSPLKHKREVWVSAEDHQSWGKGREGKWVVVLKAF